MTCNRGNALFLILIAVALFAALSYAVTQSGRGGGTISRETAQLQASQLTQYLGDIRLALQRMMLGGCTDYDISFETPALDSIYAYAASGPAATPPCEVFDPQGGGLTYIKPDAALNGGQDIAFMQNFAIPGLGTDYSELVAMVPGVSDQLCRALNQQSGIGNIIPPAITGARNYGNVFIKGDDLYAGAGVFGDCAACESHASFCVHFSDVTLGNLAVAPTNADTNMFIYAVVEK